MFPKTFNPIPQINVVPIITKRKNISFAAKLNLISFRTYYNDGHKIMKHFQILV